MRATVGAIFWLLVLTLGFGVAQRLTPEARHAFERTQTELWSGLFAPSPSYEVEFRGRVPLDKGSGVFLMRGADLTRVGEVVELWPAAGSTRATVLIDSAAGLEALTQNTQVIHRTQSQSFLFCLQTLVHEERWDQIRVAWDRFRAGHEQRILRLLRPVVSELVEEFGAFFEAELQRVLADRQPQVDRLLERYRTDLTQEHVLPFLLEDVWPLAREHGRETSETIGRELWQRAPLFDLAWRAAYDAMMADRPVKLETRWRAFVQEEVLPVFRENEELILDTIQDILRAIGQSEDVQGSLRAMAVTVLQDPELRQLTKDVLRDLVLENERLDQFLTERFQEPRVQQRLSLVNEELQVFFNQVGNMLFYAEDGTSINPDLAKVLRVLLLKRDRYYLFLEERPGPELGEGEKLTGVRQA